MRRASAHPRVDGENDGWTLHTLRHRGSSPHGRGKLRSRGVGHGRRGLIPAWAGKTRTPHAPSPRHRAHPRMGGENASKSSRVRNPPWLIPAWAGKTHEWQLPGVREAAHPRKGGENRPGTGRRASRSGSSPHGRGKPGHQGEERAARGLIPAWAGKTRQSRARARRSAAHPRMGGENRDAWRMTTPDCGSSPHGRGKHNLVAIRAEAEWLIPAWAGKTSPCLQ